MGNNCHLQWNYHKLPNVVISSNVYALETVEPASATEVESTKVNGNGPVNSENTEEVGVEEGPTKNVRRMITYPISNFYV